MEEARREQERALRALVVVLREYGAGWRAHKTTTGVLGGVLRRVADGMEARDDSEALAAVRAPLAAVQAKLAARASSPRNVLTASGSRITSSMSPTAALLGSPRSGGANKLAVAPSSGSPVSPATSPRRPAPALPGALDRAATAGAVARRAVPPPVDVGRAASSGGILSAHRHSPRQHLDDSAAAVVCDVPRQRLEALRAGTLALPPASAGHAGELGELLRGTLAVKSRHAVEEVLACHLAAQPWEAIEPAATRAYARLYFRSAFDPVLAPACEHLLVLLFENPSPALERVKRAAIEAQLRGAARAKGEAMGAVGAHHIQSGGGAHVFDCGIMLADRTMVPLETSLVPPALRAVVREASQQWHADAQFGVPLSQLCGRNAVPAVVFRLCAGLRLCKIPLSVSDAEPERLARMRNLLARRVMPSLARRHANTLTLLLEVLGSLLDPLLGPSGKVISPADPAVTGTLSLVAACFADLVSARCLSLASAAVLLCRVLVRGPSCLSAMLPVESLIVDRATLLPPCAQSLTDDPFNELVG